MSMSNIEYSVLKKRAGLHNRGFLSLRDEEDIVSDIAAEEDMMDTISPEVLQLNNYGEYYAALQDFEE